MKNSRLDFPVDLCWVDELQAFHAGAVRPPEVNSAAPECRDGETRGSIGSPVRMRYIEPS